MDVGRFAPSTTGPAHPGTLLAALLCWLDARSRGARCLLRLEDLDPQRCRPEFAGQMQGDLGWLGLDWDGVSHQRDLAAGHEAALDRLAEAGRLYPCRCSRAEVRSAGAPVPDGGHRYPGTCRGRSLPGPQQGGWRACAEPLRLALPAGRVHPLDEGGLDLSQDPEAELGDPIVRRRDGAVAYHLACVVDDAASGVTRIVRGRDLASSTATQWRIQRLLDLPTPVYRHHLLLLERHGGKLAKLHGSVGAASLRLHYRPDELCGLLAHVAGLQPDVQPVRPVELLPGFSWSRVARADCVLHWTGERLELAAPPGGCDGAVAQG